MALSRKPLGKRAWLFTVRMVSRPFVSLLRQIPWDKAERAGCILGFVGYALSKRYRTVAIRNLQLAYPELSVSAVKRITKQTFCNFFRGFVEFFIAEKFGPEEVKQVTELRGAENVGEALRRGRGGILLTAHMGNWELVARRLVAEGFPVNVIARDSDDPTMTGVINNVRQRAGYTVYSSSSAVKAALRSLRSNELLGILPDQNAPANCVFVDFFGRPVATAAGTAMFVIRTGAAILPTYSSWDARSKKYICTVYPPMDIDLSGDTERDVLTITQAFTANIEREIRKRPAEWLWLHNRWKRTDEAPQ